MTGPRATPTVRAVPTPHNAKHRLKGGRVGAFADDPEAWAILRRAAVTAGDADVAAMAKARIRELRR